MLVGDLFDMQLSPDSAMVLENVVAKYYCQQFFNYFGRAAQVLHRFLQRVIAKFEYTSPYFVFFYRNFMFFPVYNSELY